MRRRITASIVGVAALILIMLGAPLAIAVHRSILDSEVVELQATAAITLTEIEVPLDLAQLASIGSEPDAPPLFSVYDRSGRLVFGTGPATADAAVRDAREGVPVSTTDGEIVVATPITDRATEQVIGVLRLAEPLSDVDHRSRVAWAEMVVAGLLALGVGWLIAERLARRLSLPVIELADAAAKMGDGRFPDQLRHRPGIAELDTLTAALEDSARRINEALARERRFSADVSHQLRTPLTGIRLRLEAARAQHDPDMIGSALEDLRRLEVTIDHLLAVARDNIPASSTVRLDTAALQAAERWTQRMAVAGRRIVVTTSQAITTRGAPASVDQIIDVLIDNALHHGHGTVTVRQRRITGGAAVDVADQGSGISERDAERIFERGRGEHNGIGLALARSMAEAGGGRLFLSRIAPTTFSLVLLEPDPIEEGRDAVFDDVR